MGILPVNTLPVNTLPVNTLAVNTLAVNTLAVNTLAVGILGYGYRFDRESEANLVLRLVKFSAREISRSKVNTGESPPICNE